MLLLLLLWLLLIVGVMLPILPPKLGSGSVLLLSIAACFSAVLVVGFLDVVLLLHCAFGFPILLIFLVLALANA